MEAKSVKALTLLSLKRTFDLFVGNHSAKVPLDEEAQKAKIACKIRDEYSVLQGYKPREAAGQRGAAGAVSAAAGAEPSRAAAAAADSKSATAKLIDTIPSRPPAAAKAAAAKGRELVLHGGEGAGGVGLGGITSAARAALNSSVMIPTAAGGQKEYVPSAAISRRLASKWPRPEWHAPWRTYRVISGHLGWVRSVAFEPGNEWFATGSADRTIKVSRGAGGAWWGPLLPPVLVLGPGSLNLADC